MPHEIHVFEPAMCCPTGVCGTTVDPELVRFAADVTWLTTSGVAVERSNLAQQPGAFIDHPLVTQVIEALGAAALPLAMVDGQIRILGAYPTRTQLARWVGITEPEPTQVTDSVRELVAIGAAIASNCEACFRFHYDAARRLGVSHEDMYRAVSVAQQVKEAPARSVLALAERYLNQASAAPAGEPAVTAAEATCGCASNTESPLEIKLSPCC